MALKTTLEKIEETQAAITAALKAQVYGDGRNTKEMPALKVLYEREEKLLSQYAREQRTSQRRGVQYVNPER